MMIIIELDRFKGTVGGWRGTFVHIYMLRSTGICIDAVLFGFDIVRMQNGTGGKGLITNCTRTGLAI